ncbi:MAG: cyclic nucleotide-binding domain-containing protein [Magnetococcales bacterium]|nr:cyclic nucleotide-binding domain-containing protein [Magnetococcales bacterium]
MSGTESNIGRERLLGMMESLSFFKDFTPYEKKRFAGFETHVKKFKMGEYVIRQGSKDTSFFILISGTVSVTQTGKSGVLAQLNPGDFFGEVSFLTGQPRISNIVADVPLTVLRVDAVLMERLGTEIREKIKDLIIIRLINRLDDMNKLISSLSFMARY